MESGVGMLFNVYFYYLNVFYGFNCYVCLYVGWYSNVLVL